MSSSEYPAVELHGRYRDRLRDATGRITWDRGWQANTIVTDCRRLLATFMRGVPAATGLMGVQVGGGLESWDITGPPAPVPGQTALVDTNPHTIVAPAVQIDFLDAGAVTPTPTNRLQIQATLGPGLPPWPDANHLTGNLREFGLVGQLGGSTVLINYVTHPVIAKDPLSTLERTIWLVF